MTKMQQRGLRLLLERIDSDLATARLIADRQFQVDGPACAFGSLEFATKQAGHAIQVAIREYL